MTTFYDMVNKNAHDLSLCNKVVDYRCVGFIIEVPFALSHSLKLFAILKDITLNSCHGVSYLNPRI